MNRGGLEGLQRIVFWQPIESPHQHDFLEALAAAVPGEVILAVESALPACRVDQGWRHAPHKRVRVVDVSSAEGFGTLVAHRGTDSLHVFSGFFSHRIVWRAFRQLTPSAARLAILSEAPEQGPWTGGLKRARGRWLGDFRFIAVGQMIRRKGLEVLMAALADLDGLPWRCDFYGSGPLEYELRRAAGGLPQARVGFHPPMANGAVRRAIAASDCCVVPSRHDGWGMVVNEALIAGTPVVCSDGCGAADMIDDPVAGMVVPAGRVRPLAEALHRCLSAGKIEWERRCRVHAVAKRHDPAAGVRAFLDRLAVRGPSDR